MSVKSEDLPHKSGITTWIVKLTQQAFGVGRLAPQIGDYDLSICERSPPTWSEDLPHKSGITTRWFYSNGNPLRVGRLAPQIGDYDSTFSRVANGFKSEDLPHKSGITTSLPHQYHQGFWSEDLPHKSGITTRSDVSNTPVLSRRKTCPTNRGLRRFPPVKFQ